MLTHKMILDGLQYYQWQTGYPLNTTSDSMCDFLTNELADEYEIIESDGSQCVVSIGGIKYELNAYGVGDFCNHELSIYEFKEKGD